MKKDTVIIRLNEEDIDNEQLKKPAEVLKNGGLVAFPTETVYGLGANALDEDAVASIFKAKGRPSDNPLIVHIYDESQLSELVSELPKDAQMLMDKFWPGPLTLIFKKSDKIPSKISAGLETVAIRMPKNKIALKLIEEANLPIAAPSANTSGRPSPTNSEHVIEDLAGRVDLVIDGGQTGVGLESTVLDLTGDIPLILRPGGVTYEDLTKLLGKVEYDPAIEDMTDDIKPRSPGQKYRHYSPKAEMEIFSGDIDQVVEAIRLKASLSSKKGLRVGILASDETKDRYKLNNLISMGSRKELSTIGANLFQVLREFDKLEVDLILSECVEETEIGKAIMNRMKKAAGGNITYVK